jgi:hypothetical protein
MANSTIVAGPKRLGFQRTALTPISASPQGLDTGLIRLLWLQLAAPMRTGWSHLAQCAMWPFMQATDQRLSSELRAMIDLDRPRRAILEGNLLQDLHDTLPSEASDDFQPSRLRRMWIRFLSTACNGALLWRRCAAREKRIAEQAIRSETR